MWVLLKNRKIWNCRILANGQIRKPIRPYTRTRGLRSRPAPLAFQLSTILLWPIARSHAMDAMFAWLRLQWITTLTSDFEGSTMRTGYCRVLLPLCRRVRIVEIARSIYFYCIHCEECYVSPDDRDDFACYELILNNMKPTRIVASDIRRRF